MNMCFSSSTRSHFKVVAYVSTSRKTSGDEIKILDSHLDKEFTRPQEDICSTNLFILVCVISHVNNFQLRNKWRTMFKNKTLEHLEKNTHNLSYKMVFLVAMGHPLDMETNRKVLQESRHHGDILQVKIPEEYPNLVFKSWTMLRWFDKWCTGSQYLLKIDDDVFLNLPKLSAILQMCNNKEKEPFILGRYTLNHTTPRSKSSKWYISEDLYNKTRLPDSVTGAAYVMSKVAARQVVHHCWNELPVPAEDIFLTGICREKAGVRSIFDHRFCYSDITLDYVPDSCVTFHHPGQPVWNYRNFERNYSQIFDYAYNNGYMY